MNQGIRALLLAGGKGTRLRPLTLTKPKCLVELNGKPILGHWLDKLEQGGCEGVLVNTHYLSEQVESYLRNREQGGMDIKSVHEPELLGTAGTLINNQEFFRDKVGLLIHADNAMADGITDLLSAHKERADSTCITMLTFKAKNPEQCGIVAIDENGIVTEFHEKVEDPPGDLANGAVYAFSGELLGLMGRWKPETLPWDFSVDVLPKLLGKIGTVHTNNAFIDVGTPDALRQAQELWGRES